MRLRSARGVVVVAVAFAVGAAVGSGQLAQLTRDVSRLPVDPLELSAPVAAAQLPAFADCAELRRWQVRSALSQVGPWGLGPPVMTPMTTPMGVRSAAGALTPGPAGVDRAVGSSPTGTNVQVAGVDEPDVAKTDGRLVVRLSGGDLVVTDVTGSVPRELARLRLPGRLPVQPELLLRDGHVVVVGQQPVPTYGGPVVDRRGVLTPGRVPGGVPLPSGTPQDPVRPLPVPGRALPEVRVLGVDLTDPAAPRVVADRTVDGSLVAARQYTDGTVRLVVSTPPPPLRFVTPTGGRTARQAGLRNRAVVRRAPATAWLPTVRSAGGTRRPLLGCGDVRHPVRPSGPGTLSVVGFPAADPAHLQATAVTAAGDLAYSSADRVYVGTTRAGRTTVHAFDLAGPRTTYAASGTLPGTVAGRWSLDEHAGLLRVLTSVGDPWDPRDNQVVVLAQHDGRLVRVGRVGGLGRGERVTAVRWFGDLAVVVTFRQTDPLHTLDLSDPQRPRVVGVLRVPGFSSYLHPAGDGLLVGVGHDATGAGVEIGAQVAAFDVADPAAARRTDTVRLGRGTEVPAGTDPRLFTYLPLRRVLVTAVEHWDTGTTDVVALHVSRAGLLRRVATWDAGPAGTAVRTLPLAGGRLALVGDGVRVVDVP